MRGSRAWWAASAVSRRIRVVSYGEVDELNACMGLCAQQASEGLRGQIEMIQQRLFDLGAHLADARPEPQLALDRRHRPA